MNAPTHSPSLGVYFSIFFALLAFTGITVGVAFLDLGPLNTIVAMVIAGTKALLVIMYFMHLRSAHKRQWLIAFGGLFWLALLIVFVMADIHSRPWLMG